MDLEKAFLICGILQVEIIRLARTWTNLIQIHFSLSVSLS